MTEVCYLLLFVVCMGLWGLVVKKELLSMVLSYALTTFSLAMLALFMSSDNGKGYFFAVVLVVTTLIEITVMLAWCREIGSAGGNLAKKI